MGNGDEPEQPDNPHEPDIDNIKLTNIKVIDDTGYEYDFWGEIDLTTITMRDETRAVARMRRIKKTPPEGG